MPKYARKRSRSRSAPRRRTMVRRRRSSKKVISGLNYVRQRLVDVTEVQPPSSANSNIYNFRFPWQQSINAYDDTA